LSRGPHNLKKTDVTRAAEAMRAMKAVCGGVGPVEIDIKNRRVIVHPPGTKLDGVADAANDLDKWIADRADQA
jgi:hypothetical protein